MTRSWEDKLETRRKMYAKGELPVKLALDMLADAPQSDVTMSRINKNLTQKQAVDIIHAAVKLKPLDGFVDNLLEKRVWQVFKNQKKPKYDGVYGR